MKRLMKKAAVWGLAVSLLLTNSGVTAFAGQSNIGNAYTYKTDETSGTVDWETPVVPTEENSDGSVTTSAEADGEAVAGTSAGTTTELSTETATGTHTGATTEAPSEEVVEDNETDWETPVVPSDTAELSGTENEEGVTGEEDQADLAVTPTADADGTYTYNLASSDDFVELSKLDADVYQNANIVIAPHDQTPINLSGKEFKGFGSEAYPFAGSISISGEYTGYITLDRSLFNVLSQVAKVSVLNLKAANNTTSPVLADKIVKGTAESPQNITVNLDVVAEAGSVEEQYDYSSFGGIIGELGDGASVSLTVKDNIKKEKGVVSGTGNRGFFCNTLGNNASLTVSAFTGESDYSVISTDGNAGGFVGELGTSAQLTVDTEFTYTGSVKGSSNAGGLVGNAKDGAAININAACSVNRSSISSTAGSGRGHSGGLSGYAENPVLVIGDDKKLSVNASLSADNQTGAVGGLIGYCKITEDKEFDFGKISINTASITSGLYAGGVFGVLYNSSADDSTTGHDITLQNGEDIISNSTNGDGNASGNYGGLIGKYDADSMAISLLINDITVSSTNSRKKNAYSGMIAQSNGLSYVKVCNLDVTVAQSSETGNFFGGLVAYSKGDNASDKISLFLDAGTVKITGSKNNKAQYSGGLAGYIEDGVVRLSGKTDLSGIKPYDKVETAYTDNRCAYSQLVNYRDNVLIYAVGTGSDYDETKNTGWTLVRNASGLFFNDIGNWGEVLRVDGTKLRETQNAAERDTENLLSFDTEDHTVTIGGFSVDAINSQQDFAALAMSYQCGGAKTEGALRLSASVESNSDLKVAGDIDLTDTGITGFARDNGSQTEFTGILDGADHTITLDIGDVYGVKADGSACVQTDNGCGQIYEHNRIGLFADTGATTIKNLKVKGNIYFGMTNVTDGIRCGVITADQSKSAATFENVISDVDITTYNGDSTKTAQVGGFTGYAASGADMTFTSCSWTGSILNECNSSAYTIGGYVGVVGNDTDGGKITLTNSSIGAGDTSTDRAAINVTKAVNDAKVGGILGSTESGKNKGKVTITADDFTVNGLDITSSSTKTTGGLLGYEWKNVDFTANGIAVSNSSLTAEKAEFGGLVYSSSGHWVLTDGGIKYGTGVSFTGKSDDSTPSALLVCRGDDYNNDDLALYLEVDSDKAYSVDSSVSVTKTSGTYFDELVGITMGSDGNGIVSIATGSDSQSLINRGGCTTYKKQLSTDYDNPNTRYYYNLNYYDKADSTIESGKELVMWSAFNHAESNIESYFSRAGEDDSTTISGTIDLQGLSYYPVDLCRSVTLDKAAITFDYEQINANETSNKSLNNEKKQHYMMQMGLFNNVSCNITDSYNTSASITITDSSLAGTVGQTADGESGALIVGRMEGSIINNRTYPVNIQINGLTLDGIYVTGSSNSGYDESDVYAPLLINSSGSNGTLVIKNVTTSEAYKANSITHAATSLLGNIGNSTARNLNITFENMKLDARTSAGDSEKLLYNTKQSIFTGATFIESFMYDPLDTASAGSYTFKQEDTVKLDGGSYTGNVTYGLEISNTESGRNPGMQYYYLGDPNMPVNVEDVVLGISSKNSTDTTGFAGGKYLRYVAVKEGSETHRHEIDINIQKPSLLDGCGTYDDPYIIRSGVQLKTVADFISGDNSTGWEVNLPYSVVYSKKTLATHDSSVVNEGHYKYVSGTTWKTNDAEGKDLTPEQVRVYMRNAYYQIANDITLPDGFCGLGGSDPTATTFNGVIVGKKNVNGDVPTVYVTASGQTTTFGGLIAFSQGSVVKDLILDFDGRSETSKGKGDNISAMNLTIKAQGPSQERSNQSFFGGVIGYIVGGDNIIDNVTVNGLSTDKINIEGEEQSYENIADIGGYVGLIGGNLESGGGVIFRNISGSGISEYATESYKDYYYRNPFVGRVLDGYACSEDCSKELDNTDKNYKIPQLDKTDKLEFQSRDGGMNILISSSQDLWVLSAIVNSGAGGCDSSTYDTGKYNNDAYLYGRCRTGSYENVGDTASGDDKTDCGYWGGYLGNTKWQKSYFVLKYSDNIKAAILTKMNRDDSDSIIFQKDCDMTSYGNGFRGIGTSYQDNKNSDIRKRTMSLGSIVGDAGTNMRKVTMNRVVKEYASEGSDGWWVQGIGLFPVVNFWASTTVQYLTISGKSLISYNDDRKDKTNDYIGETSAGGLAGMTANRKNATNKDNFTITFSHVITDNLTVTGSKYSGGFVGVVGQSSRTTSTNANIIPISTAVVNLTFDSCSYSGITIEGGYSAGGFVGTYRNEKKTFKVTGTTKLDNSKIGWVKDACLEMYNAIKNSTAAKENGYSGGGGVVGYYWGGDMTVNPETSDSLTIDGLYIYGPQFAYNCDYGLGGIIGLQATSGGSLSLYNTTIKNTAVEVVLDPDYKGKYTQKDSYYTTPACGLIKGYSRTDLTIKNLDIQNCYVLNAGYCGGLVGQQTSQNNEAKVEDTIISELTVYTQGSGSYAGSSKVGGLFGGSASKDSSFNRVTMTDVKVVSDGTTGLIQGMKQDNTQTKVSDFTCENCIVATTQEPSGKYYLAGNTDPGQAPYVSPATDSYAGAAGLFVGVAKTYNIAGTYIANQGSILGYNISVESPIIGYYCGESSKLYYKYDEKNHSGKFMVKDDSGDKELTLSEDNIGVYISNGEGTPYSKVTISDDNKCTGGFLGLITGGMADGVNAAIKIVGMSVKGGYYPYELNGKDDETFVKKTENITGNSKGNNYVIFADYSETSFGDKKNTAGTVGKIENGYPNTTATSSVPTTPYVTVNASSDLTVYKSASDSKGMKLTSDGMNDAVKSSIINDLSGDTYTGKYAPRYNRVTYRVTGKNEYRSLAYKFNKTSGEYKDKVTTFFDASESKKADYSGIDDFGVLMIDTTNSSDITKMVNEYISVLTNCEQTGDSTAANRKQYTSVNAYTYQWNSTRKRFEKVDKASLIVNADNTISVRAGAHDNQNNQFTVLDVYYHHPVSNSSRGYHLFIPVVVKKILQTEFSIKMHSGSSDYAAAYPNNNALLASYGENFTAQLTYSYIWTADEWNNNIAAGVNFLWSYDKQVKLGGLKGSLGNATTRYTLVDMNRRDTGNTFFTGDGTALEDGNDAVLKFDKLKGFKSVYISDLLPLTVSDNTNGTLKKVAASDKNATVRVWNGSEYDYYAPKTSSDSSSGSYYNITVKGATGTNEVKVSEVYYLTVNCKDGEGFITQIAELGLDKMTSSDENALPSKKRTNQKTESNQYTLGQFYNIKNASISPASEDKTQSIKVGTNDYIDLTLDAEFEVPADYKDAFVSYAAGDQTYFRFVVHIQNDGEQGSDQILANYVDVSEVKLGDTDISAGDYTCEVTNGVLYLTIKNKKGRDFITDDDIKNNNLSKKIHAKVRLDYGGDAGLIDSQFPLKNGDDDKGIFFSVTASLAYSESGLDGSSMTKSGQNGTKYYRENNSSAELTYNAYDTVSMDGNVSQLGINGKEAAKNPNKGAWISTKGMYNAMQMSTLNTTDKTSRDYPNYLVGTLKLQKKTGNSENWSYEDVNMSDYFELISFNNGESTSLNSKEYSFKLLLSDEQVQNLDHEQIEFDIAYFVKSDSKLEELTGTDLYANYKVVLSAHLAHIENIDNLDGDRIEETIIGDEVSDYIIYTNAKLYNGIISTRDFDKTDGTN